MPSAELAGSEADQRERVFDAFRRWGYMQAELDPLGRFLPQEHPELNLAGAAAEIAEIAKDARRIYCGPIGAEFMHMPDPERREWVRQRMEGLAEPAEPPSIASAF